MAQNQNQTAGGGGFLRVLGLIYLIKLIRRRRRQRRYERELADQR
jgi:hypothetical protein